MSEDEFSSFRTDRGVFRGLCRGDVFLALALGVFAALWAQFCTASGLPPELWEDLAAAVGLRPPLSPYPALWRVFVGELALGFGLESTLLILKVLGSAFAFVFAALTFLTLRDSLEFASAPHVKHPNWRLKLPRIVVAVATGLLSTSVPMMRLGRFFGPETFLTLLAITALFLMRRFLRSGGTWALYLAVAIVGVTAAETPLGFVLFLFVLVKSLLFIWRPYNPDLPIYNPVLRQSIRWHLTGIFAWCFILTTVVGSKWFAQHNGWAALEWSSMENAVIGTLAAYGKILASYSGLGGWFAGFAVGCVPFVLTRKLYRSCLQILSPMPFGPGVAYIALLLISFSQFAQFSSFWFWSLTDVRSPMLAILFLYMTASAFVYALSVWVIDIYCRNERMVWIFSFPDALETIDLNPRYRQFAEFLRIKARLMRKYLPPTLLVLIVVLALPLWRDRQFNAASELVEEGVIEAVNELKGVRWLFSDGRFDAAIELEAARRGERLTALSLLAPRTPRTQVLNHRDVADDEDRLLLTSASETLKSWILGKKARLDLSAMQLGVEMFARTNKQDPVFLGLVARTDVAPDEVERSLIAAEKIEKSILEFYSEHESSATFDRLTGELVHALQWRISRLLRFRAAHARREGDIALANSLDERGDTLDNANEELKALVRKLDWMAAGKGETLTPREGLKVALARPDFVQACCYALPILRANPDDPEANFAVAMRYLIEKNWASAESHFRKVLASRPNEVAVINNLAIVCFHQGKTEEALKLALEAQKIAPSSEAVADTIRTIRKALH